MIVEIQENDSMECTGNDYKISILKVGCRKFKIEVQSVVRYRP